ncbi:hypothetical protein [Paraburkholderia antibiotica]|uniref:Uncharacterized protein n=1 Tax=Paraburkholderia antibiotica TaxID=2728839 RepID=A0A7Y0FFZ6_9BURK|nr:hypothetical protein [Paraburkholderia antibiotica]NML34550.1 hypothetical protein [Paraburkholderia antibiotica]
MKHVSTATMVERLTGMLGTGDLSNWEEGFVRTLDGIRLAGKLTSITEKQVESLEQLHNRYFA